MIIQNKILKYAFKRGVFFIARKEDIKYNDYIKLKEGVFMNESNDNMNLKAIEDTIGVLTLSEAKKGEKSVEKLSNDIEFANKDEVSVEVE